MGKGTDSLAEIASWIDSQGKVPLGPVIDLVTAIGTMADSGKAVTLRVINGWHGDWLEETWTREGWDDGAVVYETEKMTAEEWAWIGMCWRIEEKRQ